MTDLIPLSLILAWVVTLLMQQSLLAQARRHLRESRAQTAAALAIAAEMNAAFNRMHAAHGEALTGWNNALELLQQAQAATKASMATTEKALAGSDRWEALYRDLYQAVSGQPEVVP